jgi:hypothetical protein
MGKQQVFRKGGVQHCTAVESLSFVLNCDCDFSVEVAATRDVNSLAGIVTVAVDHCIRQGLKQGHLDVAFTSIRDSKLKNEPNELIDEWGHHRDPTWQ